MLDIKIPDPLGCAHIASREYKMTGTTEGDSKGLQPGSHTYSVARLDIGGLHTLTRPLGGLATPEVITDTREKLAHVATSTFGRVRERHPERRFACNTGVLLASDNRLYAVAVIERVR